MTETSRFWNGTTVGDGVLAPYEATQVFSDVLRAVSHSMGAPDAGYVFNNSHAGGKLAISSAPGIVTIADGFAMVQGCYYNNSAPLSFVCADPVTGTRIDRMVLLKHWFFQTVRLVLKPGIIGGSEPILTQTYGAQWEMPLWKVSVAPGGAFTFTDERELSPQTDASYFVPYRAGAFPSVSGVVLAPATPLLVTMPSVPSNAIAVMINIQKTSGTWDLFTVRTNTPGNQIVSETIASATPQSLWGDPLTVPLADTVPKQIQLVNGMAITVAIQVVGWYVAAY